MSKQARQDSQTSSSVGSITFPRRPQKVFSVLLSLSRDCVLMLISRNQQGPNTHEVSLCSMGFVLSCIDIFKLLVAILDANCPYPTKRTKQKCEKAEKGNVERKRHEKTKNNTGISVILIANWVFGGSVFGHWRRRYQTETNCAAAVQEHLPAVEEPATVNNGVLCCSSLPGSQLIAVLYRGRDLFPQSKRMNGTRAKLSHTVGAGFESR